MPTFDTDRIFNESPKKVLIREYQNLKNDYTKRNAISYKMLYENKPLSFILENSRYIFSEPMKGYDFYKSFIENAVLPFHKIEDEYLKIYEYVSENQEKMSDNQKTMYNDLLESVNNIYSKQKNSINLYSSIMENSESVLPCYDLLYEYMKNNNDDIDLSMIKEMMNDEECVNIMDSVNIGTSIPKLSSDLFMMLESIFVESPVDVDDYMLNSYTSNVLRRMIRDTYITEKVNSLQNMNLRHIIKGLAGVSGTDIVENALVDTVEDSFKYVSATEALNDIFNDHFVYESNKETNDKEKAYRLLCEKAIIDMELAFCVIDEHTADIDDLSVPSGIVEQLCIESTEIEKIPQTILGNINILESKSEELKKQIVTICEKYFSADGSPSSVVSQSVGDVGRDNKVQDKKHDDYYTPSKNSVTLKVDDSEDDDENEIDDHIKREESKKRKTEKYSRMSIDDSIFNSVTEKSKPENTDDDRVLPPEKKNIFQRIQNKALDMNVKFKKKVAKGKRTSVDAKNAGKAVTKIPMNISNSVKKSVNEWDEMDDNRRKEYIIKPGFRKKYFRALKLCIMHYGAFAINPVLNIVLAICHKASNTKNVRIRNELIRELKAEIKVTEEKIEDAKSNGDNQQKYKLMRIKEKLEAEVVRISSNSKFI